MEFKLELKVLLWIFSVAILIGLSGVFLKFNKKTHNLLQPLSETISAYWFLQNSNPPSHKVYGFLPYWVIEKEAYIKTQYLTDIAYFGLNINADGTIKKYTNQYELDPGYNTWRNSKDLSRLIKRARITSTRVALTIISHDADVSDTFLFCEKCWPTLANEIITELNYHQLHDINLNFEYASYTDKPTALQYSKLTKYLNDTLDERLGGSFVAVSAFADSTVKSRVTDIESLAQSADAIFIMSYDFHQPTSETAGPVAPVEGAGTLAEYDIKTMIKDYTTLVSSKKLILGVPYYGYNWVVESSEDYATRVPGDDYIGFSQSQTYTTIMDLIHELNILIKWDGLAAVPYFNYISPSTGAQRQVYFETEDSLRIKYRLAKDNDFAGVGIWALGYDGERQELWNLIKQEFIE